MESQVSSIDTYRRFFKRDKKLFLNLLSLKLDQQRKLSFIVEKRLTNPRIISVEKTNKLLTRYGKLTNHTGLLLQVIEEENSNGRTKAKL